MLKCTAKKKVGMQNNDWSGISRKIEKGERGKKVVMFRKYLTTKQPCIKVYPHSFLRLSMIDKKETFKKHANLRCFDTRWR